MASVAKGGRTAELSNKLQTFTITHTYRHIYYISHSHTHLNSPRERQVDFTWAFTALGNNYQPASTPTHTNTLTPTLTYTNTLSHTHSTHSLSHRRPLRQHTKNLSALTLLRDTRASLALASAFLTATGNLLLLLLLCLLLFLVLPSLIPLRKQQWQVASHRRRPHTGHSEATPS